MAYVNLGARLVHGLILVFKSRSSSFQRAQTTIKIYNNNNNNNNINKSSIYLIIHLITTVSFFFFFFNKVVIRVYKLSCSEFEEVFFKLI